MKIGVIGSRELTREQEEKCTSAFSDWYLPIEYFHQLTFLFGGAKGVSSLLHQEMKTSDRDCVVFKPWNMVDHKLDFDPKLFFLRNKQIIDNSDLLLVFKTDKEEGEVNNAIMYAKKVGVETNVYTI